MIYWESSVKLVSCYFWWEKVGDTVIWSLAFILLSDPMTVCVHACAHVLACLLHSSFVRFLYTVELLTLDTREIQTPLKSIHLALSQIHTSIYIVHSIYLEQKPSVQIWVVSRVRDSTILALCIYIILHCKFSCLYIYSALIIAISELFNIVVTMNFISLYYA